MTFAEQRHAALLAGPLNASEFAEDVTIKGRTVRAKVTHDSLLQSGKPQPRNSGSQTVEELERIAVTVSRLSSYEYSLPTRPQPGDTLERTAERDPDTRPFTFVGDVYSETDIKGVYYFQRHRRVSQGGR